MFEWLRSKASGWQPPKVSGPSVLIKVFRPSDVPVSKSVAWEGDELTVCSNEAAIKSLFDVRLPNSELYRIAYRFLIRTDNLNSAVYPQMWCRIPEKGQFFSQGVDRKISGTNEWREVEIPFYLEQGQVADLLHLNLAFEGPGAVRLKDIEVTSTPVSRE